LQKGWVKSGGQLRYNISLPQNKSYKRALNKLIFMITFTQNN